MASTKHNDDKGYKRGARGIDGNKGEDYVRWGGVENAGKVTGDDGGACCGQGKSAGAMQKSAKGK